MTWLADQCAQLKVPVYALSGVSPQRVESCLKAGAHGVAVMSGIMGLTPDEAYAQTLRYLRETGQ